MKNKNEFVTNRKDALSSNFKEGVKNVGSKAKDMVMGIPNTIMKLGKGGSDD